MEEQGNFKRTLGLFSSVSILAGIIIGTGIFLSTKYVFINIGENPNLALLVWLIGGLLSLFAGLCYAELGAAIPKAGGAYVYIHKAFGPYLAFLSGISKFLVSYPGTIAGIAIGFAGFLGAFMPESYGEMSQKMVAIVAIIVLSYVNYRGVKLGAIIQNLTLVGKLLPLVVIILGGAFLFITHDSSTTSAMATNTHAPLTFGALTAAIISSLWAYEGWNNLNNVAEEIKNPKRNLPLAIILSLGLVIVVYVAYNWVMFSNISLDQVINSANPAADTFSAIFGSRFSVLVTIGILISMLGALNGSILVFPRYYYAMAEDKLFFPSIAEIDPKTGTPSKAILWSALISIAFVLIGNFGTLSTMVVFMSWVFNALTIVSLFVFRKTDPDMERPYKVIGYPVIPILVIVAIGLILFASLRDDAMLSIIGIVLTFGVGTPLYMWFKSKNQEA